MAVFIAKNFESVKCLDKILFHDVASRQLSHAFLCLAQSNALDVTLVCMVVKSISKKKISKSKFNFSFLMSTVHEVLEGVEGFFYIFSVKVASPFVQSSLIVFWVDAERCSEFI